MKRRQLPFYFLLLPSVPFSRGNGQKIPEGTPPRRSVHSPGIFVDLAGKK